MVQGSSGVWRRMPMITPGPLTGRRARCWTGCGTWLTDARRGRRSMTVTSVPTNQSAVEPDLFRGLLRHHAAGVVVVTAPGAPPAGFTATSFTSVSLDPPLVSFGIAHSASAWSAVRAAATVAVHVLGEHQESVARTFATSGIDRFAAHGAWRPGPDG